MFTDAERAFIGTLASAGEVRLARFATSTLDGQPHVVPLRAVLHETADMIIVLGREMASSYKYRQVGKNPRVAIVWDSQEPGPPPAIKGIEVRGRAVIKQEPGDSDPHFEVTPTKVFSWGINEPAAESFEKKMGMDVAHLRQRYGGS
jgi:pyridoxamine 5'-phosphate oxidase family protein